MSDDDFIKLLDEDFIGHIEEDETTVYEEPTLFDKKEFQLMKEFLENHTTYKEWKEKRLTT